MFRPLMVTLATRVLRHKLSAYSSNHCGGLNSGASARLKVAPQIIEQRCLQRVARKAPRRLRRSRWQRRSGQLGRTFFPSGMGDLPATAYSVLRMVSDQGRLHLSPWARRESVLVRLLPGLVYLAL